MTTKPMLLILAVEPDANQAAQLVSMAKRHLRAEFVVAATADAALEALGKRVPDLILTPVLLASRDEMVLTDHLRQLGAAAAHVQTLAIPILSSAEPTVRERTSRLMRRRRQPPEVVDRGCDPAVFAEQVKTYLERASGDRPALGDVETEAPIGAAVAVAATEPVPVPEDPPATTAPEASSASQPDSVLLEEDAYEEWLTVEPSVEPGPEPLAPQPPSAPVIPPEPAPRHAMEAELGLEARPGHTPQLWRVAVGLTSETAIVEESAAVTPAAVTPAGVTPAAVTPAPVDRASVTPAPVLVVATPVRRRPRANNKPSSKLDDWAYFDPSQSGFKALIRRLDELAAQYDSK